MRRAYALCLSAVLQLACAHPAPLEASPPTPGSLAEKPRASTARDSFIQLPGLAGPLYVTRDGREGAPPLLLIHGLGDNGARDFAPLMPALRARYDVLAFDLPGLARSRTGNRALAPRDYAELASTLITQYFGRPAAVLGHSMGGAIALQLAADHPAQVTKLALLDVAGVLHYREYLREVIGASRADMSLWRRTLAGARGVLFEVGLFPMRRMKLEELASDASPLYRVLVSSNALAAFSFLRHDFGPAIRRVTTPTYLGWGAHDTVAPLRTATMLRASLPVHRWHSFARSGHVPMRSEPHAVSETLLDFLDTPFARVEQPPLLAARNGRCERLRKRVFEGDYDRIVIRRCKGVLLRNVRARYIEIDRSEVELEGVKVDADSLALSAHRSRVRWTGGDIHAGVCMQTNHSQLNLAGVRCTFRQQALRVYEPTTLLASASTLTKDASEIPLHGEYELFRTAQEIPPELEPSTPERVSDNSRTRLPVDLHEEESRELEKNTP